MIPTAEEFLDNSDFPVDKTEVWDLDIHDIMIKFAKLHVQAALKEASENAFITNHNPTLDDDRFYKKIDKLQFFEK